MATSDPVRFSLDPRLENDTVALTESALCTVRLMNDQQYPWLVVVPKIAGAVEITDLREADHDKLWQEIRTLTAALHVATGAEKMNVATLGNVVNQLHIHIVARFAADNAWPGPIWGKHPAQPYANIENAANDLRQKLGQNCAFNYAFS